MSNKYKDFNDHIPSEVLVARLRELAKAVTGGFDSIRREFDMRIPAERDRDADLVIGGAARRITELESEIEELREDLQ